MMSDDVGQRLKGHIGFLFKELDGCANLKNAEPDPDNPGEPRKMQLERTVEEFPPQMMNTSRQALLFLTFVAIFFFHLFFDFSPHPAFDHLQV